MCHILGPEALLNIVEEVKSAPNYPAAPKKAINTGPSPTVSEVCKKLSPQEKKINQKFEILRTYYEQQVSELEKLTKSDTEVAELDSQISAMQTMQKKNPATAKTLDAAIQAYKNQRDAITVKPRENLDKFLEKLKMAAQGLSEPQEHD